VTIFMFYCETCRPVWHYTTTFEATVRTGCFTLHYLFSGSHDFRFLFRSHVSLLIIWKIPGYTSLEFLYSRNYVHLLRCAVWSVKGLHGCDDDE
jgi:hypothetical protein